MFPDDDEVAYALDSIDVHTDWRRETCPEEFFRGLLFEGYQWRRVRGAEAWCRGVVQRHMAKRPKADKAGN